MYYSTTWPFNTVIDINNSICHGLCKCSSFFELTRSIVEQQPCINCIAIDMLALPSYSLEIKMISCLGLVVGSRI